MELTHENQLITFMNIQTFVINYFTNCIEESIFGQIQLYYNFNRHMELRNIINEVHPLRTIHNPNKIVHQLNNEGCRCNLCQKIVIKQNKVIQLTSFLDQQSQHTKGKKQDFLIPFIMDYFSLDKLSRKIKFMLPQICIFEKGCPATLITKKRETGPMKIINNKQKLNAFQIQNFFTDGYLSHNQVKNQKQIKFKNTTKEQYYNYRDVLKNQCIVLAKFHNGSLQMLNMTQLTNLFKSKQRNLRTELVNLTTLVNAKNHNQIRVPIQIDLMSRNPLLQRAKTEVKIINQDIKQKDFMYVTEKQESNYEQHLKQKDIKKYLEYLSLKLILLYSLKTDVFIQNALFKFIKAEKEGYYLTDIQVYAKGKVSLVWGDLRNNNAQIVQSPSPQKKKVRPSSSPQKLQGAHLYKLDENREEKSVSFKLIKQNERVKTMLNIHPKSASGFKLEPILSLKGINKK